MSDIEEQEDKLPTQNFNEGGTVMNNQTEMAFGYALGGLAEDVDPVSGNEVPVGSMPEEVRDDIPAQLSEGEYVVPADVVRFFGVKFFEDIRTEAKQGFAQMESNGRVGGEPIGGMEMGGDELPFDVSELQMVDDGEPEQPMMSKGGYMRGYADGGYIVPPYTGNMGNAVSTSSPTGGVEMKEYQGPVGETMYVQFMNGKPLMVIPEGFSPKVDPNAVATAPTGPVAASVAPTQYDPNDRNNYAVGQMMPNGKQRMPDEYYMGGGDADQKRSMEELNNISKEGPQYNWAEGTLDQRKEGQPIGGEREITQLNAADFTAYYDQLTGPVNSAIVNAPMALIPGLGLGVSYFIKKGQEAEKQEMLAAINGRLSGDGRTTGNQDEAWAALRDRILEDTKDDGISNKDRLTGKIKEAGNWVSDLLGLQEGDSVGLNSAQRRANANKRAMEESLAKKEEENNPEGTPWYEQAVTNTVSGQASGGDRDQKRAMEALMTQAKAETSAAKKNREWAKASGINVPTDDNTDYYVG